MSMITHDRPAHHSFRIRRILPIVALVTIVAWMSYFLAPEKIQAFFTRSPGAGCVVAYEHIEADAHFGYAQEFCAGTYDASDLGMLNQNISSLQIGTNARITLYEVSSCTGTSSSYTASIANLGSWNDRARCITVENTGQNDYEATWYDQTATGQTLPIPTDGQREVLVKFKNVGTRTWYRSGARAVYLKVKTSPDRFHCSGSPPDVAMVESSVDPGQVATFRFTLCGNGLAPGPYHQVEEYGLWSVEQGRFIADTSPTGDPNDLTNVFWNITIEEATSHAEARWVSQTQPPAGMGKPFDVQPGDTINFEVRFDSTGSTFWKRAAGAEQVVISTRKTPGRISAPPATGYDQCWPSPGPNCGKSYFHHTSWLDTFKAASVSSDVAPGDEAVFRFALRVPDDAEPGTYEEGFVLSINNGTAGTPRWEEVANPYNGEDGLAYIWVPIRIRGAEEAYQLQFLDQDPADPDAIMVPIGGSASGSVRMVSVGPRHPNASDLVLAIKKDPEASTAGPTGDEGSSIFRDSESWLTTHRLAQGVRDGMDNQGRPIYRFDFTLHGNECSIERHDGSGTCAVGETYREDLGVALTTTTPPPWLTDSSGTTVNAWFHITVVEDFLAQPEEHEITIYMPRSGSATRDIAFINPGSVPWRPDGNPAVSLNHEYHEGDDAYPGNTDWSAFWCDDWPHTGSSTAIAKARAAYVQAPTDAGETGTFRLHLCNRQNLPPRSTPYVIHMALGRSAHGQPGGWINTPNGEHASITVNVVIQDDYMGEFVYQDHTDYPGPMPALIIPNGYVYSTVVIQNTGLKPWLREEVMLRVKDGHPAGFACDEWIDPGRGYVARFEGPGPVKPGDSAVFRIRLCDSGKDTREWNADNGYREHFVLYRNDTPIMSSDKGNSDGHVEYWVPLSLVEHGQARSEIIEPGFGEVFETTVPIKVRVSATSDIEIDQVIVKFLGKTGENDQGIWRTVKAWDFNPSQPYEFNWDISSFPDQDHITLGVEVVDIHGKAILNDWCQRVVIAKDTSGFKTQLKDGNPVRVIAVPVGSSLYLAPQFVNDDQSLWTTSGDDKVGLYRDDEPVGVCPCSCPGQSRANDFDQFTFEDPIPFASVEGNPRTGIALAQEGTVRPGQTGTFKFKVKVPLTPGDYWLNLGLAHGPHWITDSEVSNGCDSHARVTYYFRIYRPQPVIHTQKGHYSYRPTIADPIDSYSGNHIYHTQWLNMPERGQSFVWGATYNSIEPTESVLGWGWNPEYNWSLHFDNPETITVQNGDARMDTFTDSNSDGRFDPPDGVNRWLIHNSDGTYTLRYLNHTTRTFDMEGRLREIIDRNGNTTEFVYNDAGLLNQIIDTSGRVYRLRYNAAEDRIVAFEPPFGNSWRYAYDSTGNLTTVTDPDGKTVRYTYNADHRLHTITDQNGALYVKNRYDTEGRVVWQQSLDSTTTFSYHYADDGSGYTVMTDGRGNLWRYVYNEKGQIVEERNPDGKSVFYEYDRRGNRSSVTDRRGNTTRYWYDSEGKLISVMDAMNNITQFVYDNRLDVLVREIDPSGRETRHEYDAHGNRIKTTDPSGGVTSYIYNEYGQVVRMTDAEGGEVRYEYDEQGNLSTIDEPGHTTRFVYGTDGRVREHQDPAGNVTRFAYDPLLRRTMETDPLGRIVQHTYDGVGNRISTTDARNQTTRYEYDHKDRLIRFTDPMGHRTTYAYDPNDNRTRVTDAAGNTTSFTYNQLNLLEAEQDRDGHITRYEYDANANLIAVIEPGERRTEFGYDRLNRRTSIKDPLGNTITIVYDAAGNEIQRIDPNGNATTFEYDAMNRLLRVKDALNGTVEYTYDRLDRLTSMTDANGHATRYNYDVAGNLVKVTDPNGAMTRHTYNSRGLRTATTDADGRTTTFSYDEVGQLISVRSPNGDVSYTRDATGRITEMSDTLGTTRYAHNARGEIDTYTTPDGAAVGYERDNLGRIQRINYPGGGTVSYQYSAEGRIEQITDWDGRDTTYEYNTAGHISRQTLPNGVVSNLHYDDAGYLTEIVHTAPDGQTIARFAYTYNRIGDRTHAEEFVGGVGAALQQVDVPLAAGWSYIGLPVQPTSDISAEEVCEADSQITQVVRMYNGFWNSHPCGTGLNNFALEAGRGYMVHSSGAAVWRVEGYALPDKPLSVTLRAGWNDVVPVPSASSAEEACQALASRGADIAEVVRLHNGFWNSHPCGTGLNDFPLAASQAVLVRANASADLAGQPAAPPSGGSSEPVIDGTIAYGYDALRRLTSVTYPDGEQVSYAFDPMGNRTTMRVGSAETTYQYDAADRLLQAGDITFTWDRAGRMIRRTQQRIPTSYTYDARDRMLRAGDVTFAYDGAGRRMRKVADGQMTSYTYNISGDLPYVLAEQSPLGETRYLYGPLGLLARIAPDGMPVYYHADALGSVRALSNLDGKLVAGYAYDAFGAVRASSGLADGFSFTGEQTDAETGFVYLRARFYAPEVGRFTSKDSFAGRLRDPQSLNRFAYVQNNPVHYADPSGHEKGFLELGGGYLMHPSEYMSYPPGSFPGPMCEAPSWANDNMAVYPWPWRPYTIHDWLEDNVHWSGTGVSTDLTPKISFNVGCSASVGPQACIGPSCGGGDLSWPAGFCGIASAGVASAGCGMEICYGSTVEVQLGVSGSYETPINAVSGHIAKQDQDNEDLIRPVPVPAPTPNP
ncbi:MAG: hypothetical protein HC884_06535 [Chloroflexaceae bacterium]|nr:hypothetical protein [Chloroflexaceae bacterium]